LQIATINRLGAYLFSRASLYGLTERFHWAILLYQRTKSKYMRNWETYHAVWLHVQPEIEASTTTVVGIVLEPDSTPRAPSCVVENTPFQTASSVVVVDEVDTADPCVSGPVVVDKVVIAPCEPTATVAVLDEPTLAFTSEEMVVVVCEVTEDPTLAFTSEEVVVVVCEVTEDPTLTFTSEEVVVVVCEVIGDPPLVLRRVSIS
jgi:hypothetical protein